MTRPKPTAIKAALWLAVLACCATGAARAQILGPPGGVVGRVVPSLPGVEALPGELSRGLNATTRTLRDLPPPPQVLDDLGDLAGGAVASLQARAERLLREHPRAVEPGLQGEPVVRGEILALAPSDDQIGLARARGFRVLEREELETLGLQVVKLGVPRGMPAAEAIQLLRGADPQGSYELNPIYFQQGQAAAAAGAPAARAAPSRRSGRVTVGIVDGAVAAGHPSLARTRITQKSFAPGGGRPAAHATAIASLISGEARGFRGGAPRTDLLAADVYGTTAAGGSASAIANGLDWLARSRAPVVNISLGGPDNALLRAAVGALTRRGTVVVAAVGNDGPAAPPLYPAAYAEVVAVTGVDARRNVLPEAGRSLHVDFAAPGAGVTAASLDGRYTKVRGTSFAAPVVASRIAALTAEAGDPARALQLLRRQAEDLGPRGRDAVYGDGLVEVRAAAN